MDQPQSGKESVHVCGGVCVGECGGGGSDWPSVVGAWPTMILTGVNCTVIQP